MKTDEQPALEALYRAALDEDLQWNELLRDEK